MQTCVVPVTTRHVHKPRLHTEGGRHQPDRYICSTHFMRACTVSNGRTGRGPSDLIMMLLQYVRSAYVVLSRYLARYVLAALHLFQSVGKSRPFSNPLPYILLNNPAYTQVDSVWRSVEGDFSDIALLPKGQKPNPPEGLYVARSTSPCHRLVAVPYCSR